MNSSSFTPAAPTATAAPDDIPAAPAPSGCYHCGQPLPAPALVRHADGHAFCCDGCQTVYSLLADNGLCAYYTQDETPGTPQPDALPADAAFAWLDDEALTASLLLYRDATRARIGLHIPGMHCRSCIWLLEHLHRLNPHILRSEVDFGRKRLTLDYAPQHLRLSTLVALLHRIGYAPLLNLEALQGGAGKRTLDPAARTLWLRLGVAGFGLGNLMLLAFPDYLAPGEVDRGLHGLFAWLSLVMGAGVYCYAGWDYLANAVRGLRFRYFTIDQPLALGMTSMFVRSVYEVLSGTGVGYFDSLAGLIFFLLLGKVLQRSTWEALAFDRDYRAYFPLSAARLATDATGHDTEQRVPVTQIEKGQRIVVRTGELIPADAFLVEGQALIDNTFLTGESAPVAYQPGDLLYAGGRQTAGRIVLLVERAVNNSRLTSLWNHPSFDKAHTAKPLQTRIDRISAVFTVVVVVIAVLSAAFWFWKGDSARAADAFTAVLIIACPCALAFAAPFTFGHLQRLLGREGLYARNPDAVERLGDVDTLVFDKTGTLTDNSPATPEAARPQPVPLVPGGETALPALVSIASQSAHPLSQQLAQHWPQHRLPVSHLTEQPGKGLEAIVTTADGPVTYRLGSAVWCGLAEEQGGAGAVVGARHTPDGWLPLLRFETPQHWRAALTDWLPSLRPQYQLHLVSGDSPTDVPRLVQWMGSESHLRFRAQPADKRQYLEDLQRQGHRVAMIGDGLNDAGALQQADCGIAVTAQAGLFTPASDAILDARALPRLPRLLRLARSGKAILWTCFAVSLLYNLTGTVFAVQGDLEPVVAACLMPFSSIGSILLARALTSATGKRVLG